MKKNIKDYILYSLMAYAFVSAIGITPAEIFLLIGLALWIADVVLNKPSLKQQFSSPITLPLAVFLAIHLLAALFGIDILNSLKNFRQVYIILMFFLAMNYAGGEKEIRKILDAFIAGAVVVGLWAIAMTIKNRYIGHNLDFRASSFSGNHMHAGGMLMMAFIISAGAFFEKYRGREGGMIKSAPYLLAYLIISAGLVFTYTRGSWLGALLGLFVLVSFASRRLVVIILLVAASLMLVFRETSFMQRAFSSFKPAPGTSAAERVSMWKSGLQIIRDHPLLGIGTANVEKIYPKYRQPEAMEPNAGHLHNNLIQVAVIDGLPGLGAFLWIFAAFWASMIKTLMKNKKDYPQYVLLLAFCVNIAFFVNGFFEYNLFSTQVAIMFWFLMGIGFSGIKSRVQSPESRV
jgi:putative inorganic carbon (HCO3(-)) transporter